MPSETDELLRSIRRWLRTVVFLLGVTLVALSHVGYTVAGYGSGALYATTGLVGGVVALFALIALLNQSGNRNPEEAANAEDGAD